MLIGPAMDMTLGHVRGLPPASHDWWLDRDSLAVPCQQRINSNNRKVLQTPACGRLEHFSVVGVDALLALLELSFGF